jgi:magnesium and cobalt transporter
MVSDDDRTGDKPTLMERITAMLLREPEDREELTDILRGAFERHLLDADALSMIEGVLSVSEATVRDIMIPRAQMDCVSVDDAVPDFLPVVVETRHSRFPVIGESKDDVIGILLAKELLNYYANPEAFNLRDTLRPAVFVPESKRLNVLLRDFRANRNHIAIVVDEYGGVSGLVTIEDVLEQIVGDIEDEYDFDEEAGNIIPSPDGKYRVRALTGIEQFNEEFGTDYSDEEVDTIGGLVTHRFGRVPHRGEKVRIDDFVFEILRGDARQIHVLLVRRAPSFAQERRSREDEDDRR